MDMLILSGNDIVCQCIRGYWCSPTEIAAGGRWVEIVKRHAIGPGEYIVVQYGRGEVGPGIEGLNYFSAHILELKESVELAFPADAMLRQLGAETRLSKVQGMQFIAFIKGNLWPWVWENATAKMRSLVSGEEPTAQEKASDLVRQAVADGWNYDDPLTQAAPSALLHQAIALYPGVAEARYFLGKMAISQGSVEEAITCFTGELRMASKPAALNAHSYLAIIHRELGREREAQHHAAAAMRTEEYRRMPTQLSPDVVEKVRAAVRRSRAENCSSPKVGA
jgi:hypothetical protein